MDPFEQLEHQRYSGLAVLHRGQSIVEGWSADEDWYLDGINVFIIRLSGSDQWWIVAENGHDDDKFTDLGPYESAKHALTALTLLL